MSSDEKHLRIEIKKKKIILLVNEMLKTGKFLKVIRSERYAILIHSSVKTTTQTIINIFIDELKDSLS